MNAAIAMLSEVDIVFNSRVTSSGVMVLLTLGRRVSLACLGVTTISCWLRLAIGVPWWAFSSSWLSAGLGVFADICWLWLAIGVPRFAFGSPWLLAKLGVFAGVCWLGPAFFGSWELGPPPVCDSRNRLLRSSWDASLVVFSFLLIGLFFAPFGLVPFFVRFCFGCAVVWAPVSSEGLLVFGVACRRVVTIFSNVNEID